MTKKEEVKDEHLSEVFKEIKGIDGAFRDYINFEDFKTACMRHKPACLLNNLDSDTIEEHFRNICESCNPVFDNDGAAVEEDLAGDLGNAGANPRKPASKYGKSQPVRNLKKRPTPHYLTGTAASRG